MRKTLPQTIAQRLLLLFWLLCSQGALGQVPTETTPVPPPPPLVPQPIPGEPPPFNPDHTREASPGPRLNLRLPELGPPRQLTLFQAAQLARELQPDLQTARGQLRQAEGAVVSRRAALMPRISGSSSFQHSSSPGNRDQGLDSATLVTAGTGGAVVSSGGRTTDRLTSSLGLSQLLFDFGRTRSLVLEADLNRQAAAAALLATENDLMLQVKERFYTLIQARRLVAVREDELANRQEQLRLARALYDAGDLAPGDVVRAQTAVTNTVVSLNRAQQQLEQALQDQARSLGLSPLAPLEIETSSEPDLPNKEVTYLLGKALDRRPDMLVAQKNVEAGEAALGAAYALNRPELSAFTGITYQGDVDGVQRPTFTAQLQLNFDLYDGGARAGAVTSAEGSLEVARADLQRTRLSVESEVGSALAELLIAERNVTAAQAGVNSAREGVRIALGRYQVALGSLTDVFDAQSNLVTAQINLATSQGDLDLARSRLRHAIASPFEEGFDLAVDQGVDRRVDQSPVERDGQPSVEREGRPPVDGEGQPSVEREGQPSVEREGQPSVDGEGRPSVEREGRPPVDGEADQAVDSPVEPSAEQP
jgi:outer membrane protein